MEMINTIVLDSNRKEIKDTKYNFVSIMDLVFSNKNYKDLYPLLSSVDPYDDTVFNRYQLDMVNIELNVLLDEYRNNSEIQKMIEIVSGVKDLHYLKLIGD